MYAKPESETRSEVFGRALYTLEEEGPKQQSREDRKALHGRQGESKNAIARVTGMMTARRGTSLTTDGYLGTEMGMGQLAFGRIDFGGTLKLNAALKKK